MARDLNYRLSNRLSFLTSPLLLAFCFILLSAAGSAADSSPRILAANATASGDLSEIVRLGQDLPEYACTTPYCSISFSPIFLSVQGTGGVNLHVDFRSASFPRNIDRISNGQLVDDLATRPVLLRGTGRIRHSANGTTDRNVPVAATLFRDSAGHYILISTRRNSPRGRLASVAPLSIRIPLHSSDTRPQLMGRTARMSSVALKGFRCGNDGLSSTNPQPTSSSSTHAHSVPTSRETFDVVYVATDFDTQFANKLSCSTSSCNNKVLSFANSAAVYYQNQLGMTFTVRLQYGPNASLGSSTVSETLLENFRRINNSSRSSAAVDLYQLYTGRTLIENVIGLAFVGVTCSQKAFADMLVQRVSDAIDPVTVAHEAGHTFNATHPSSSEGGIMDASVGSSPPTSFSTRSLAQMRPYIDANYASCIGGSETSPTATPTVAPTSTPEGTATPTPGPGTPTATPIPGSTPSVTPSATATPRRSNGGNSGSDTPRTITLRSSLSGRGAFTLSATTTDTAGCTLTISAGGNDVAADPGTTIVELVPTTTNTSWVASMPFRVKPSKTGALEIVFFARRTCNGVVTEMSKFPGVRPSRVAARLKPKQQSAYKVLSKRAWIAQLVANLTQQ